MEFLNERKAIFQKALETLTSELAEAGHFDIELDDKAYRRHRDSVIQRFEYCTDLFWKYIKAYLAERHGVIAASPKSVFREAVTVEVISGEEAELAIKMIDVRNNTSHIYREEIAEDIYAIVPRFYALMASVLARLA